MPSDTPLEFHFHPVCYRPSSFRFSVKHAPERAFPASTICLRLRNFLTSNVINGEAIRNRSGSYLVKV
ncbi:hypothetical protein OnM2_024014 [Erysiphe neolycopersici]|uniref:Uncharacterized protein n=1 Tax=Erysiphe neolycopersici TaxID=212602 RepID=A0A420I1P9_9PEZI|nr:hypothetical protein OnM2_024014 [Erysiphe neolycopersici]